MTRKDYIAIAECVKEMGGTKKVKADLVDLLSGVFYRDNHHFDKQRFVAAVMGGE